MTSLQTRYDVYVPAGQNWNLVFSVPSVTKEGGAIDQLYDKITTGPECCIAIVFDTMKNRHVQIFRTNKGNTTTIEAKGGWKEGDHDVVNSSLQKQIDELAKVVAIDIEHADPVSEAAVDAVESAPHSCHLTWVGKKSVKQFMLEAVTEKQLKALLIASGNYIGGTTSDRQAAALERVAQALGENTGNKSIAGWEGIWKDTQIDNHEANWVEGKILFILCGYKL